MDSDTEDLVRHLFAAATAVLEDAIEPAIAAQAANPAPQASMNHAAALREAAADLGALGAAIGVLCRRAAQLPPSPTPHRELPSP